MTRFFVIAMALLATSPGWSFSSFKATLSSGYYRDIEKNSHSTVFFNWNYNYLSQKGYNTHLEFGINNNLVQDKWGAYPYQLFVSRKYEGGNFVVGRHFFTELFEVGLLDGVNWEHQFNKSFGVKTFAGMIGDIEDVDYDFHNQIYGVLARYKSKDLLISFGPHLNHREGNNRSLLHGSLYYIASKIPLKPTVLLKEQWDIPEASNDQRLYDLQLSGGPIFLNFTYASRKPDPLIIPGRSYIYELFSTSHQEVKSVSLLVNLSRKLSATARVEEIDYNYLAREQEGDLEEITLSLHGDRSTVATSLTRLNSYGGTYWNYGLKGKYNLTDSMGLIGSIDITKVKKINSIKGYAYHGRGGFDFQLQSRWRALINAEIERNHLFEFDLRAVSYLTYYYF